MTMATGPPQHAPSLNPEGAEDLPLPTQGYRALRPGPGLSREAVAADQRLRLRRAVVELVAEDGFQALTVRGLSRRARVSNGAFYSHFRSTDDCFLSTYDLICRHAAERLMEAGLHGEDPCRRVALAVDRLLRDIDTVPETARFMLRSAPASGPAFTPTLRASAMHVGGALKYCLRAGGRLSVSQQLLGGVVAGLGRIGRLREAGLIRTDQIPAVADETAAWVKSVCSISPRERSRTLLPGVPERRGGRPDILLSDGGWAGTQGDDRAMMLSAAFRIAKSGYHRLTVPRICREAGVPKSHFSRHFESVEDCFSTALRFRGTGMVRFWRRNQPAQVTWNGSLERAYEIIRDGIEGDVDYGRLLLVEIMAAGTLGIDSRDHLISQIAQTVRATAPEDQRPTGFQAEAATAAAWSLAASRFANRTVASPR